MDWINATVDELAEHISLVAAQTTQSQIRYYKLVGNEEILTKIQEARILAKKLRIIRKADEVREELRNGG